jgi:hypothetical protein
MAPPKPPPGCSLYFQRATSVDNRPLRRFLFRSLQNGQLFHLALSSARPGNDRLTMPDNFSFQVLVKIAQQAVARAAARPTPSLSAIRKGMAGKLASSPANRTTR